MMSAGRLQISTDVVVASDASLSHEFMVSGGSFQDGSTRNGSKDHNEEAENGLLAM